MRSSRRPGHGDQDVDAARHGAHLRLLADAAEDHGGAHAEMAAVGRGSFRRSAGPVRASASAPARARSAGRPGASRPGRRCRIGRRERGRLAGAGLGAAEQVACRRGRGMACAWIGVGVVYLGAHRALDRFDQVELLEGDRRGVGRGGGRGLCVGGGGRGCSKSHVSFHWVGNRLERARACVRRRRRPKTGVSRDSPARKTGYGRKRSGCCARDRMPKAEDRSVSFFVCGSPARGRDWPWFLSKISG